MGGRMANPMQPLAEDKHGTMRFKENAIVMALLDHGRRTSLGLNEIAGMDFTQDDRCQLAQLIGYSLSGYHELSYVSDEHAAEASAAAKKIAPGAEGCRDNGCGVHLGVERDGGSPSRPAKKGGGARSGQH